MTEGVSLAVGQREVGGGVVGHRPILQPARDGGLVASLVPARPSLMWLTRWGGVPCHDGAPPRPGSEVTTDVSSASGALPPRSPGRTWAFPFSFLTGLPASFRVLRSSWVHSGGSELLLQDRKRADNPFCASDGPWSAVCRRVCSGREPPFFAPGPRGSRLASRCWAAPGQVGGRRCHLSRPGPVAGSTLRGSGSRPRSWPARGGSGGCSRPSRGSRRCRDRSRSRRGST